MLISIFMKRGKYIFNLVNFFSSKIKEKAETDDFKK